MFFFRWIGLFLFVLLHSLYSTPLHEHKELPNCYYLSRSNHHFYVEFNVYDEKKTWGTITKSFFHLSAHYDAYDRFGLYEGRGICKVFSLGSFYTWASEIELFDDNGDYIGVIHGDVASASSGTFSFFNEKEEMFAIGYLDEGNRAFSLLDVDDPSIILATLRFNKSAETIENWEIIIHRPDRISHYFVKIFAAFVCDKFNLRKSS